MSSPSLRNLVLKSHKMFSRNTTKLLDVPSLTHTQGTVLKGSHRHFSMSNTKLVDVPSHTYTHGTCGIPQWEMEKIKSSEVKVEKMKLPAHLIRPPCVTGGTEGGVQTCVADNTAGLYCPPCSLRYKYAAFSDNINFTPPKVGADCWWQSGSSCEVDGKDTSLDSLTKVCDLDN